MKKQIILALAAISILLFAFSQLAESTLVFSDNFSSGNFAGWSASFVSPGATQLITDGMARFTVPTPSAGVSSFSYIRKDGFTSTVNSTIIAAQDVYVTKVPYGCQQGNGAIFFFYVSDSSDPNGGNKGNIGVGIDGSDVWSLWIGGNITYNYVFQTSGPTPLSNVWYHIVLKIDNQAGMVSLAVNGLVLINLVQHEFTDRTHSISLMSGMGEDWWSSGSGQQEIDVDNVLFDVSDMPEPTPSPTPIQTPTSTPTVEPTITPTLTPTTQPNESPTPIPTAPSSQNREATPTTLTPTPHSTARPSTSPQPSEAHTQTLNPTPQLALESEFPLWIFLPVSIALATAAALVLKLKRR